MASKTLINLSNLQKFLLKLNEKFALKKAMKGISEDAEGNIIIGEEGLVPTPNENSKGKFLRSDGEWALPSETAVYDSMTIEEGVAGVSEVNKVLNAKNLKQIVNSDGFLTSLDSSKLTGIINIENLPQGALERILIVSSKEERLTLSDTEVQLGDVVKESDTGLMYYVINTEKLNSEEGYTQFTAGMASSVPWSGVTNKPTIPTKTSDLTNDSGFAIDSDVVHTSGDETISGAKTFTQDIILKDNNIDLTVTPSSTLSSNFIFKDKNNQNVSFIQYAKRNTDPDLLGLYIYDKDKNLHGIQITSNNYLLPNGNNIWNLGSPNNKWQNAHVTNAYINKVITYSVTNHNNTSSMTVCGGSSWDTGSTLFLYGNSHANYPGAFNLAAKNTTNESKLIGFPDGKLTWNGKNVAIDENLVHTSGDEYISGTKMFSNTIHRYADLTTSGGEQVYRFDDINANGCGHIYNNVHWNDNAVFNRHGTYNNKSGKTAEIDITCNDSGVGLLYATGTATNGNLETVTSDTGHTAIATMGWVNNPKTSTNVVHRSGNETINGVKYFNNLVYLHDNMSNKNSRMDLFTTPANTLYAHYMFVDKNNEVCAYMQYGQQNTGTDFIGLFIHDKNRALHGIQVTTNNEVIPLTNNAYSLGSSNNKWKNVYATTFNGNLKGNADTATKAKSADSVAWANITGKPSIPTTTPNAYVTATWASGSNWYRKWSNGFIEMGGFTNCVDKPSSVVTTNLPIAFSNTNYTLLVQQVRNGGSEFVAQRTDSKSTTSFVVCLNDKGLTSSKRGGFDWYACGY